MINAANLRVGVVLERVDDAINNDLVHPVREHGRYRGAQNGTIRDTPVSQEAILIESIDDLHQIAGDKGSTDQVASQVLLLVAGVVEEFRVGPDTAESCVGGVASHDGRGTDKSGDSVGVAGEGKSATGSTRDNVDQVVVSASGPKIIIIISTEDFDDQKEASKTYACILSANSARSPVPSAPGPPKLSKILPFLGSLVAGTFCKSRVRVSFGRFTV